MLTRVAPRFVISRIIQNAYQAEAMSVELLKQPLEFNEEYFATGDAKNFHVRLS